MGWPCYTRDRVHYTKCGECQKEVELHSTSWFERKLVCDSCHESLIKPLIEAFKEQYEAGVCEDTDDIKCPYCGHDNDSSDAFDGGEPKEWACGRCNMEFDIEVEYSYTFQSKRRE